MKKSILVFAGALILLGGIQCVKQAPSCYGNSPDNEKPTILTYANSKGLNGTFHSSGLYYQITDPGSGVSPTATSTLSVKYTGKFLDGTVFDSQTTTPISLQLAQVITGWQIGLPLIKKGGTIKLIVPSALAYGCKGRNSIPSNAILYFEIELVDVQ